MKRIKIGQIGIGHNHANEKMLAVRRFPELFEVIGYAEKNEDWISVRGDWACYQDLPRLSEEEIIRRSDAVLVETDVWDLTATAQRCLDAGKHIHMDKPASGTLEEHRHMLKTAADNGLVVQLGYMYRYNPAVRQCLDWIKEGRLGEIYSINAEMSTFHSKEYKEWLTNFQGGIQYILGSHLIDLAVYILGKPQRTVSFLKHTGLDGVDLADNNLTVLEYEKAIARIFVSSVEVNGWGRRQLVVSGSKGTMSILPIERDLTVTWSDTDIATNAYLDQKIPLHFEDNSAYGRYDDMIRDFHAYILGEKENPFSYAHDLLVHQVIDEAVGGIRFYGKDPHCAKNTLKPQVRPETLP